MAGGRRPGRISTCGCRAQRLRPAGGAHARALGRRRAALRRAADRAARRARARLRHARGAALRGASSGRAGTLVLAGPVARIVPERSVAMYSSSAGRRRARWRGATARWTTTRSPTSSRLLSAPLELRDDERRDRPRSLEPGGADALDGRRGEDGRSPRELPSIPCPCSSWRARTTRGRRSSPRARSRAPARRPLPELRARAPLDLPGRTRVLRGARSSSTRSGPPRGCREGRGQRHRALLRRRRRGAAPPARGCASARPWSSADLAGDRPLPLQGAHRPGAWPRWRR